MGNVVDLALSALRPLILRKRGNSGHRQRATSGLMQAQMKIWDTAATSGR
jgi:hypothetical protein